MKHIDTSRERTKRRIPRRFMGVLLAAAVTASVMPTGGFAVSDATERTTELCAHHPAHTADCGYSVEDNTPCGYECRVCPVEDLIAALPEQVTEDNADDVRAQLDHILDLYRELDEGEQGQLDLSRCYELQEALDNANAPVQAAEEIDISKNLKNILTAEDGGCPGHTFIGTAQTAMIYVESGAHNVTFSSLNIFGAAYVGIAPGATMNLTIEGTNTIQAASNLAGIYVPVGATLVINGNGSLNVSGSGGAGIGGAIYVPDENSSDGDPNCGTVEINGGTVTATGDSCCAGIGGGVNDFNAGNGGNVTINGGTVTATGDSDASGSYGGAGIGGAGGVSNEWYKLVSGSGGTLTINGGNVTLKAGQYGSQYPAYGFGQGSGSAPAGGTCELTLADASCLTVDSLDPKGKYTINGDPTADMIVVPEGLVYTGQALDVSGIKIDDTKTGTGTYFNQSFTVKADKDGWVLQPLGEVVEAKEYTAIFKKGDKEISKKFTVAQSGTDLADGKVKTYNGSDETTDFSADNTITVKAAPTATGAAPQKAAARLRADPAAGQMALFVGDVQVSEPVNAGEDGIYTMTISAADVLLQGNAEPNGNAITLTAKFLGNDNMADGAGTVAVNITAAAKAERDGAVIGYYGERKLEKAFAKDSGNSGATITMLTDVELYDYLGIYANCTLDLNGKTIRVTHNYDPALSIYNSTTLTITGNGKVISDTGYALFINGNVTLNGGTFIGNGTNAGVYVDSRAILSVSGENVVIQGKDGYGLSVNYANSVRLSAGKYSGGAAAIACLKDLTLGDMLTEGCAYYNGDTPIPLSELAGQKELTGGVFTVKKCGHDGITPTDNGNGTHSVNCPYCGNTKAAENCAYTFSGATGTCAACGDSVTVSVTDNLIYDGTEKKPEVTVTRAGTELTVGTDYTVAYTDNKNAGTATVTVTIGNGQGSFTGNFIINPAAPTITWSGTSQELTYTGNPAAITAPIVTLVNGENFSGAISYSYKKQGETDYTNGLPVNAGAYSVKAHIDAAGNYAAADSTELTLTIAKAQGTLTVPASPIEKTFGDEEFALNCTTNGDGRIFYSSDNENVATVSADGTVLIKGAGEAEITVSLGEGENYTGADAQTVRIAVAKAAATDNISETKNYTYANGSKGTVTIDVAGKLPRDRGETTYSVSTTDDNGILTGAAADENGNLVFTVSGGVVGNTASITVTAEMANYGDATYTLNIKLVEKKVVEPKTAVTVKGSNILTYGETLSELAFNSVIFVEQGTETEVKGTLSWKNPDTAPTVGTKSAEWVFTPEDNGEYAELTGTAAIAVVKATPNVKAPTAENITYDPSKTLPDVGLSGGSAVWTVNGSSVTVEGAWSWKSASTVPTVRNSGYTAVFTPSDTVNYNTAECTVAVAVAKAEPYIAVPPTAAQITYGDSLSDSVLDGGTVQYSNSDATAVAGGFAWKDGTIKPVVSDSGSTEYAVIFTPTDTANYNSTETKLTLTVKKAENAPNMPSDVMNVKRSCEKVSDVELPKDWQWLDADKDTALEINVGIKATAVYVGTDKGNYEHETAEVTITRADCDHIHTELRNVKAATCKEKGYSGDTYCLDCEKLLLKGSETDTTDHSGGVATCTHGKICDMCGMEYTAKDSGNHTHTEIRGAKDATCTAEGYTGDTYCTDCETITETGTALPIVPHDWQVTSEEPATTVSEGKRIYTCSMCKQTREETLPKLPQPSHKHSYSEKTTKEATCTESGEAILSCSCGDTIIRSISALGHNYRSEVTKPATVTEAGVMTYTCTRCGHSYTETIKKLEGDPTKPDTRPETGKPFIKDENGKDGWSIINEELGGAEDGSTVTVDMNGAAVVPKTIFDALRGRDVTAVFDMGGGITWSVNGKDVTSDKTSDINFSVKSDTENIPVDVINNITGERYSIQISLAHNGEFGFTAVLSINLGNGNAGQKAALYYYNGGTLELMCESEISADGTARLTFTHASDYLIVIGEGKTDESDTSGTTSSGESNPSEDDNSGTTSSGEVSDPSNGDKDDNDGNPSTGVAVSLIPLAAAAAFIIAAAKRKKK